MHRKMCARTRSGLAWDRAHLQVDGLDRAEGPLDVSQRLVVAHALGRIHLRGGHGGANDVQAVQRRLAGEAVLLARPTQGCVSELRSKCLPTFVLIDDLPTRTPIASCPLSLPASTRALILLEVALGGATASRLCARQPGQRFIAAGHQALTGVVRRAQLEQIALIEQVHLKMPLLEQRTDRCAS